MLRTAYPLSPRMITLSKTFFLDVMAAVVWRGELEHSAACCVCGVGWKVLGYAGVGEGF